MTFFNVNHEYNAKWEYRTAVKQLINSHETDKLSYVAYCAPAETDQLFGYIGLVCDSWS